MMTQTLQPTSTGQTLSEEVRAYLQSADAYRKYEKIALDHGANPTQARMLSVIVMRAITGVDPIAELSSNLQSFFEISAEQVKSLLKTVGQNILEPIAHEIDGLEKTLTSWGVSVDDAVEQEDTQTPAAPTIDQFIRAFVESMPDELEPRLQHRLERLLMDFAKGATTKEETTELLTRSEKTRGVGLDPEAVPGILAMVEEQAKQMVRVEVPAAAELPPVAVQEVVIPVAPKIEVNEMRVGNDTVVGNDNPTHSPLPAGRQASEGGEVAVRIPKIVAFTKEDEEEIARLRKEKQHVVEAPKAIVTVDDVTDRVCKDPVFQFEDPQLQQRCVKIVESRVRDVRDAFHTRAQFEKSAETGGLGLTGRRLADMTERLEQAVQEYHSTLRTDVDAQKAAKVSTPKKPDEQTRIDDRYQNLTKQVRQAIETTPTPATTPVRPPLVRPQMKDVQFAKRLVGPVDELRTMSATEFRRLSEIPERAAEKVMSKVDLLETQGYDQKVQGITAWRQSPLYKQYVALAQEALVQGLQVEEVLTARQASGEDVLTLAEYQAIMKINAALRF